ncbi:hypothetical protein NQ176_g10510 [Zarea fungicola]|uniref:Uncharacterized protein n=1 Tax=Zarea fungicola TaxID=93591 RepID=A0ACC1MF80_9HYPO|nr:hypothetical protein NQ176_g10510 [Lecanicillium fungicola]
MSRSSPARKSQQLVSSPERNLRSSFLFDSRNDELSHLDALAAALAEHDRVREAALRVYELHELKEESDRIQQQQKKEQDRLRVEAEIAAKELKLQELRAKSIPRPAPKPEPATPSQPPQPAERKPEQQVPKSAVVKQEPAPSSKPLTNGFGSNAAKPAQPAQQPQPAQPVQPAAAALTFGQQQPQKPAATPQALPPPVATQPKPEPAPAQPAPAASQPPKSPQTTERYVQIHQELKKLRASLQAEAKVPGSPLKGTMGTYRREIRVSIGQLTSGRGANAQPIQKITRALLEALQQKVPSPQIEVSKFVVEPRQPVEGAANNGDTLPALFIYLINVCAKGIINQFINECGANPKAADPIGVFTAHDGAGSPGPGLA